MTHVLALCSQKGGVGKTTTAFHLIRAGVLEGMKVLAVDLDPQGNLSHSLARDPMTKETPTLAEVMWLDNPMSASDARIPAVWDGVDLLATTGRSLASVRAMIDGMQVGREYRLREGIEPITGEYDLVIIDCPPGIDSLITNALTAADGVLVIAEATLYGADGVSGILDSIGLAQQYTNKSLKVLGCVLNRVEPNTIRAKYWVEQIRGVVHVLEPEIQKRTVIGEAADAGQGLDEVGTRTASRLTEPYRLILDTVMKEFS